MALDFQVDEATAAQRRFPLYLVDAGDGITAETGEAAGQPQISKNGAAFGNTSATLTAIGNGSYYVELTAGELDTLGMVTIRYKSAATAEFSLTGQVVSFDPYDAIPPVDVTTWNGTTVAAPNTAGVPLVDLVRIVGGLVPTPTTTGVPDVNVERWLDTLVTLSGSLPDINVEGMDANAIAVGVMAAGSIGSGVIAAAELTNIENEIWDALKSAHVVANSFGDFLDIEVSSRMAEASIDTTGGAIDTVTAVTNAVTVGTINANAINAAAIATDAIDADAIAAGAITSSEAPNLDAAITSRLAPTVAARTLDVAVTGEAGIDLDNVLGTLDAGDIGADAITNAKIATDAIGSDELATSAVQDISRAVNPQVNIALNDITFEMYDSTTHNPSTGLTVTGERSLDGGAYAAVTGSITEISDGTYQLDASAADMNGALIVFRFSEATADDTFVHVKTAA